MCWPGLSFMLLYVRRLLWAAPREELWLGLNATAVANNREVSGLGSVGVGLRNKDLFLQNSGLCVLGTY